jgi:hypothetical protein
MSATSRSRGLGNKAAPKTGRSYWQILRENVFQFTNNIMFTLAVVLCWLGGPSTRCCLWAS